MTKLRSDCHSDVAHSNSHGFTLVTSLMLLLIMSGIAVSLMFMVNTEQRVGNSDLERNIAFYASEGAMEKMTSDLSTLYANNQAPTASMIQGLGSYPPQNLPGITFTEYAFTVPNIGGIPISTTSTISSGPNQGLVAQIVPMGLSVTAVRPFGSQVRITRNVEVALIPVFQFGVFSDSDLSYFPGPSFDFAGRVHTNGNLFLATSQSPDGLIFHSKISAVGEVIRAELSNGVNTAGTGRTGPVYIPSSPSGCDTAHPAVHCLNLAMNQGSKVGGVTSADNPSWITTSTGTFNSWIINGTTGARPLSLPFVADALRPIQIIREPILGELATSPVGQSRLYNEAAVRILLADTAAGLHPDGSATDAQDVSLSNGGWSAAGVPVPGIVGNTYFAFANTDVAAGKYDTDFVLPAGLPVSQKQWPLVGGFLRVEIHKTDGSWLGVTQEWLKLGFARGLVSSSSEFGVTNSTYHPNAILVLQMIADRDNNGSVSGSNESPSVGGVTSQYNWFPINLYDPREGEVRDVAPSVAASCAPNGVMNAVELDVRNLRLWLLGTIGTSGTLADWSAENGYVLYFSDRRGMQIDTHAVPQAISGEYGFEDVINTGSTVGTPDGTLEASNPGTTTSPEDVNEDTLLDNWGAKNVGDAFGPATSAASHAATSNPYSPRIADCSTTARKNRVTGARRILKLIDGTRGNLPTRPDGTGGFTVASENPVYILGNYNATSAGWGNPHSAAAVISDSVTLLSNNWSDNLGLSNPTQMTSRNATNTWYRLAIAAGKNLSFPHPSFGYEDYGTDGGVHNFLRYIEDWSGHTLNYQGSLVSLFYAQYATGIFKCCTTVYGAPNRNYSFDTLFLDPANLPPGTPLFRDVVNVAYRQDFTPN